MAHDTLAHLPEFLDTELTLRPLPGGLTNRNYRIDTGDGHTYVARFSSRKSALLSIDRAVEHRNAVAAAQAGIGPRIVAYSPEQAVLVVDWIEGQTFDSADLDDEGQLDRVAAACRILHAAPAFANDFDMFHVQAGYLGIVREHGFRLPPDYLDFAPQVERLRTVLAGGERVPCHNDLLAANIMDDGARLWLIDYEYSGNNDPCFELGNIWSEADLSLERLEHLVSAYYGRYSPGLVARARLLGLMAKYGWTLWASIQDAVSDVDFDFWAWGMEKYARAVAEFRGPAFQNLIDDVRDNT